VRIGLPWESLTAFLRLITSPRAAEEPLSPEQAVAQVEADFARFDDLRWFNPVG